MATNPMMQAAGASMTPADPMQETAGAVEICIKVAEDGSLSVYKESGEAEGAEAAATPAGDIGQALKIALDLYRELGASPTGGERGGFDSVSAPQNPMAKGSMR